MFLKGMFLYVIRTCISTQVIGWHKISVTQERVICSHMKWLCKIGMGIPFSKQYRYATYHLHYANEDYAMTYVQATCVQTLTLFLNKWVYLEFIIVNCMDMS